MKKELLKKIFCSICIICVLLAFASCKKAVHSKSLAGNSEEYAEGGSGASDENEGTTVVDTRKLIKTVDETVETKEYTKYIKDMKSAVKAAGGYIGSGSESTDFGFRYGDYTIRIPSAKLDSFLKSITNNVTVTNHNETVDDVTDIYVDIEARLKVLIAEEESLTEILKSAKTITDVLSVSQQLTDVRSQIESLQAQKNSLDKNIDYSTVNLSVSEVEREKESENVFETIGNNLGQNVKIVGEMFKVLFVFAVSALPFLLVIGAIVFVIILFTVIIPKKKKKNKKF